MEWNEVCPQKTNDETEIETETVIWEFFSFIDLKESVVGSKCFKFP